MENLENKVKNNEELLHIVKNYYDFTVEQAIDYVNGFREERKESLKNELKEKLIQKEIRQREKKEEMKEIVKNIQNVGIYDFIANNYYKLDKEQLKKIIMELDFETYKKNSDEDYKNIIDNVCKSLESED